MGQASHGAMPPALRQAAVFAHAAQGVLVLDERGAVVALNPAAQQLTGYAGHELCGLGWQHLQDPVQWAERMTQPCAGLAALLAASACTPDWVWLRRDGLRLPVSVSALPLREADGHLVGGLVLLTDAQDSHAPAPSPQARELQYRKLFEDHPHAMLLYDVENRCILDANRAADQLYGYAPRALVGRLLDSLMPAHEHPRLLEAVALARQDLNIRRMSRWQHVRSNGEVFVVETLSAPHWVGERHARLLLVTELTQMVKVENQVLDQAKFLESLLDALPMPVFYKDRQGRYLGANPAFLNLLGLNAQQVVGKTVDDITSPELALRYRRADEALYAEPDKIQFYEALMRSTQGLREVHFHKAAFRDHNGQVVGLIGMVRDVTEERRALAALRDSEARLAQVLHSSPMAVFVLDQAHRVVIWNPACEQLLGARAQDMLGSTEVWRVFYPAPHPLMANLLVDGADDAVMLREFGAQCQRSPLHPDAWDNVDFLPMLAGGSGRWLYACASPLRNAQGQVVGAIETLVDITEHKLAQARISRLNEELEARVQARTNELARANEELRHAMVHLVQSEKLAALGSLVAGVAHELNTPLGNMLTVASALKSRVEEFAHTAQAGALRLSVLKQFTQGALEAAQILERNAFRAGELIASFKQVAVDQTSARRREFDLAKVTDEVFAALHPQLKRTPHELVVDVPLGITLDSYPGPLEQVLLNLVNNALVHAFEPDQAGRMVLQAQADDEQVYLQFSDNGVGMSDAVGARAFDPFFTTRMGSGGSGLGLYIVYNLVTGVLGGSITLSSQPGQGTRFSVILPRVPRQEFVYEDAA